MGKNIRFLTAVSAVCMALALTACDRTAPDVTADPAATEPAATTAPAVTTEPEDNGVAQLTPLEDLNATAKNSHATAKTNAYLEPDDNSYVNLTYELVSWDSNSAKGRLNNAQYPRLKQLKDGSYILFWQYGQTGRHIYYAKSKDLMNWEAAEVLYNADKFVKSYGSVVDNVPSKPSFATLDAEVLSNGDILTVVSVRETTAYKEHPEVAGIYMRRSTDNGKTWENPVKIYSGVNWEPSITELSTGEIQVFFTQVSPGIAYWGDKTDRNSTGTAMICSKDGGKTWSPKVTASPWQAKLVAQQYIMQVEGSPSFTDQMSVVTELYDGSLVLACESKQEDKSFRISLVYSDDAEWEDVAYDQTGPSDRTSNVFGDDSNDSAAPYIVTMPSGETILSYGVNSRRFVLRVGSGDARTFGAETQAFGVNGYWGSIEVTGNNRITAVSPWIKKGTNDAGESVQRNSILIKSLYLNHAITAKDGAINVNGRNSEDWAAHTDSWFVGSSSQAQLTVRAAKNGNKLYLLAERRDNSIMTGDVSYIYIADTASSNYVFAIDEAGNVTASKDGTAVSSFTSASTVIADSGIVTEICIDLAALGLSGRSGYLMYPSLANKDADGTDLTDAVNGMNFDDSTTWLTVHMEGMENGSAPLGTN